MPTKKIVQLAVKEAEKSKYRFRVGAVLYKGSSIIKSACNDPGYIGFTRKYTEYPSRHAEILVIYRVSRSILSKCNLLVVRLDKSNNLAMSKPCKACQKALRNANLSKIYYSNENGKIERMVINTPP